MSTRQLLIDCRTQIADNLGLVLRSECRLEGGQPDRSTLPPELRPYVITHDTLLRRLDATIVRLETTATISRRARP